MAKTIKNKIVKEKSKKAIEYGTQNPDSEFDRRPNQGDSAVQYVEGSQASEEANFKSK